MKKSKYSFMLYATILICFGIEFRMVGMAVLTPKATDFIAHYTNRPQAQQAFTSTGAVAKPIEIPVEVGWVGLIAGLVFFVNSFAVPE